MKKQIDNESAKLIMVDILKKVSEYCDKEGIRYYLWYGTLLGAIRHKGFIPWDNDIDICIPRPDYERFRSLVIEKPISEDITILDYRRIKTFPFLKAVNNNTVLKELYLSIEENYGLYIDIFPIDGLPDEETQRETLLRKADFYNNLYSVATYRFNTGARVLTRIGKNIIYPISRLLPWRKISEILDTMCTKYNYDTSKYVGNIVWGYSRKEVLLKEWFEVDYTAFENRNFRIPNGYDQVLKKYYGNYMKMPPENQRITHYYDAEWK